MNSPRRLRFTALCLGAGFTGTIQVILDKSNTIMAVLGFNSDAAKKGNFYVPLKSSGFQRIFQRHPRLFLGQRR